MAVSDGAGLYLIHVAANATMNCLSCIKRYGLAQSLRGKFHRLILGYGQMDSAPYATAWRQCFGTIPSENIFKLGCLFFGFRRWTHINYHNVVFGFWHNVLMVFTFASRSSASFDNIPISRAHCRALIAYYHTSPKAMPL